MSDLPTWFSLVAVFGGSAAMVVGAIKGGDLMDYWHEARKSPEEKKREAESILKKSARSKASDSGAPAPIFFDSGSDGGGGGGGGDGGCG